MAIGSILKEARIKKQLSESQVAELTRMKVQLVQDLENDDFHRIAATIYGKGFIKLYAECVGLDPKPLINDYIRSVESDNPSLITNGVDHPTPNPIIEKQNSSFGQDSVVIKQNPRVEVEPESDADDLFTYTRKKNTIVDESVKNDAELELSVGQKESTFISKFQDTLSNIVSVSRQGREKLANRIADIQWGDTPLKIIGIVIGIVILLLILTISIKSCDRNNNQNHTTETAKSIKNLPLQTPVSLPEPYFD